MRESNERWTDGAVVAAVLAGDTERFAILVDRYRPALLKVARSRLRRTDWAEDAVQETFLCALKWLHSYDSQYSFRTWLWTILLNQCHRSYKAETALPGPDQGSQLSGVPVEQLVAHEALSPPGELLAAERSELLERLLQQLPAAQADALRLRFLGELKFREIADAMGCSLSCAKVRVREGLKRMSQLLGQEQMTDPAGPNHASGSFSE